MRFTQRDFGEDNVPPKVAVVVFQVRSQRFLDLVQ
jgi:hypothetical protein